MSHEKQLLCSLRKAWVSATPEEFVRQETLNHLLHLGFPHSLIAVEKELKTLVPISVEPIPDRRADIICYANLGDTGMRPLLLIECKAVPISAKEMRQVIGYNHHLKAAFIALTNQNVKKLGWYDRQMADYTFVDYFPTFSELVQSITNP
jgi:hypothetical protein